MKWFRRRANDCLKDKILKEDLCIDNIIASSFNAKGVYDELKVICHPDRYLDPEKNIIATELSQLVSKYRFDYSKLLDLKVRVDSELIKQ